MCQSFEFYQLLDFNKIEIVQQLISQFQLLENSKPEIHRILRLTP